VEIVAFRPEQIKSVFNRGTFDPTVASILAQPEQFAGRYSLQVRNEAVQGERRMEQGAPQSLEEVRAAWTTAGVENFISERDGTISLSRIVVPEGDRNTGKGTAAMQALIDYAGRSGQRIVLTPSADFGGSKSRLVEFYKRFGFVENKGRNKDFTTQETMIRPPRAFNQSAYHGTPHRGIDKFSTDNIGTGEGAQAYGWGLYFASKREIAEWYREELTGRELGPAVSDRRKRELEEMAGDALTEGEARALDELWDEDSGEDFFDVLGRAVGKAKSLQGQLYEVEIPEDDVMLLWDKPLSEQPEKVREAPSAAASAVEEPRMKLGSFQLPPSGTAAQSLQPGGT